MLSTGGTWAGLPYQRGAYTQKVFWWRDGYNWRSEPAPQLTVSGKRIDESAKPLLASTASNAYGADIGSAMLVLINMPSAGCWQITGNYKEAQLSFVVWVARD